MKTKSDGKEEVKIPCNAEIMDRAEFDSELTDQAVLGVDVFPIGVSLL